MKSVLTPEMEKYFIENAFKESGKSMCRKFGVSNSVVKRVFQKHNIILPEEVIKHFRSEPRIGKTSFTKQEDDFIKENYLKLTIHEIERQLNRSRTGIEGRLRFYGLEIPKEIRKKRQEEGMYRRGHSPANKGKKQTEYMSAEAIEKTKATRFRKGHTPKNALSVGQEVERTDSSGRIYILTKVSGKRKLQLKHRVVWEQHHKRKIPKNHNIVFKDGDTKNFAIENLECISNEELMKRNTMHNYPKEVTELIHLKSAITRQINKYNKQ